MAEMPSSNSPDDVRVANNSNSISVVGSPGTRLSTELLTFYALPDNFEVLRIVNGSSPPVSLRSIAIYVSLAASDSVKKGYLVNLRRFTRKKFDPFRRCDRVTLESGAGEIVTTEGQMNFFRWLIESGNWSFIVDNSVNVIAAAARCARDPACSSLSQVRKSSACRGTKKSVPSGMSTVAGRHVVIFD